MPKKLAWFENEFGPVWVTYDLHLELAALCIIEGSWLWFKTGPEFVIIWISWEYVCESNGLLDGHFRYELASPFRFRKSDTKFCNNDTIWYVDQQSVCPYRSRAHFTESRADVTKKLSASGHREQFTDDAGELSSEMSCSDNCARRFWNLYSSHQRLQL